MGRAFFQDAWMNLLAISIHLRHATSHRFATTPNPDTIALELASRMRTEMEFVMRKKSTDAPTPMRAIMTCLPPRMTVRVFIQYGLTIATVTAFQTRMGTAFAMNLKLEAVRILRRAIIPRMPLMTTDRAGIVVPTQPLIKE